MGNRHEREGKIKGVVSFLVWVVNGNSAVSANGILVRSCRVGVGGQNVLKFGLVEFDGFVGHPSGDVQKASDLGCTVLERAISWEC